VILFAGLPDALAPGAPHAAIAAAIACGLAWRRGTTRAVRVLRVPLALATAWLWLLAAPWPVNRMLREFEWPADDPAACRVDAPSPTIVVLGSGELWNPDGSARARLDFEGWQRVRHAAGLWRAHGGTLLMAGGPGRGADDSLAGAMAEFAGELGVPASAIRLAGGSHDTREDVAAVAELLRGDARPALLVTSALHMRRALGVGAKQGRAFVPCPSGRLYLHTLGRDASTMLPHTAAGPRARALVREALAAIAYRLRGWT
jgi:uncharacterized SAM-binding protein YcdF (DUF218 family)